MRVQKVQAAFNKMSLVVIVVTTFIALLNTADLLFHLGWGYSSSDLKLGLFVLLFAIVLRWIGLRIIASVDDT